MSVEKERNLQNQISLIFRIIFKFSYARSNQIWQMLPEIHVVKKTRFSLKRELPWVLLTTQHTKGTPRMDWFVKLI